MVATATTAPGFFLGDVLMHPGFMVDAFLGNTRYQKRRTENERENSVFLSSSPPCARAPKRREKKKSKAFFFSFQCRRRRCRAGSRKQIGQPDEIIKKETRKHDLFLLDVREKETKENTNKLFSVN